MDRGVDGSIQPFAGTGRAGFNGDAGAALELRLDRPTQLATAADGAMLVVDSGSNRIRRVAQDGSAATLAGSGDPNDRLVPTARAPFRPARRFRRRSQTLRGPGSVPLAQRRRSYPLSTSDDRPPPCAEGSTTSNLLKIQPYSTKKLKKSAAKPVVIDFGATVDSELTGYAWRAHVRYGTRTKNSLAGTDKIKLRGRLAKKSYYAVVIARTISGDRLCDARRMEVR